jgi:preprotein translocase subunit SecE/cell division septation protein DedD
MTAKTNQQALDRMADVLVEDIVSTPSDQLLVEVAEDYGNARALAVTFDKIVLRARSSNDRLATKALPSSANGIRGGLPSGTGPYFAGRLRAFWRDVIPRVFDVIFPNRLAMITISSVCIASLAFIIAAPTVFDSILERKSSPSTGPEVLDGRPTGPQMGAPVPEREAASERGVTRGLQPSAPPPLSPAVPRIIDLPSAVGDAEERPGPKSGSSIQQKPGAGSPPLQSTLPAPLAAGPAPSAANPAAPPIGAPRVASASNPAADNYVVQISLQRSKAGAEASVRSLQAKFPKELGGQKATVRRADLGPNGVHYRALVGPFGSADDADRFCSSLKAAGGQCTVQKD